MRFVRLVLIIFAILTIKDTPRLFRCEALFLLGIPFLITNYFCGNKSVFAVLNEPYSTFSTISVVCLAKTLRAEKSVFSDDFLRARTKLCFTHCKRALGKKG